MTEFLGFAFLGLIVGALVVAVISIGRRSKFDQKSPKHRQSDAGSGAHFGYSPDDGGGSGGSDGGGGAA